MSRLPKMVYGSGIGKVTQVKFGGLRHHVNCADGEVFDMENMTCKYFPVLSTRGKRGKVEVQQENVVQIYGDNDALLKVTKDWLLFYNDFQVASVTRPEETYFVRFGDRVVMMPDKRVLNLKYKLLGRVEGKGELPEKGDLYDAYVGYDEGGHFIVWVWDGKQWADNGWFDEPIETAGKFAEITVKNGEINGEAATANTIEVTNTREYVTSSLRLREGDAVTISGMSVAGNNKTAIIREIVEGTGGTCELRFSDYCFTIPEEAESYKETNITIARTMPDVDILFEHDNRLWGAKGKEIFASKIGDPFNWNSFSLISTDSYYLQTQSKGEFTAGISYGGYPRFFREGSMTTVYGSEPSSYQTAEIMLLGVAAGEQKSLCQVGGMLFWLSAEGVVIYDGENVRLQEQVFGDWKLSQVIGCGNNRLFYAMADLGPHPLADGERVKAMFVFDCQIGLWTKEDIESGFISMTEMGGVIYGLNSYGRIFTLNDSSVGAVDNENFFSYVEFGDFIDSSPNRKAVNKIQLRMEVEEGASVTVLLKYDSSEEWLEVATVKAGKKRSVYLPVTPHRCDHYRIRLSGFGAWKLYSMARELYVGSELH